MLGVRQKLHWNAAVAAIGIALATTTNTRAFATEFETYWVEPSSDVDAYWSINLSGRVFLTADIGGEPACLEYWWITWPFGRVKNLGRYCGHVSFDIPGVSDLAVGGKLRVGGATGLTRLRGTASEAVAHRLPGINF